jgi:two-component system, NtrC family, sensor kinase
VSDAEKYARRVGLRYDQVTVIAESGGWYFAQDFTNTLRFVIAAVPVESAAQRCEADMAAIFRLAGADLDELASYGYTVELQEFLQRHPIVVGRGTATGHAALAGRAVHIPDVLADPEYSRGEAQKAGRYRAVIAVPLMREGAVIGILVLLRANPGPFTLQQIKLSETFADEAAIAVEAAVR